MRRIALALGLLIGLTAGAVAQGCGQSNPNCIVPTAPAGANNNQAASTAFVQAALAGSIPAAQYDFLIGNVSGVAVPTALTGDCVFGASGIVCTKTNGVAFGSLATLSAAPAGTLSGTTLNSTVVTSTLTTVGTIGTGVWQGTLVGGTYGGTGVNNGASTLTLGASLATTGAGAATFALGASTQTYTFPTATATLASLTTVDQTLSGGANVTSFSIGTVSTGTSTIDCGKGPLQYLTNGGAFTLAAPSSDGSCVVQITNNGSAGAVTFSGFTVNSSYTGGALTTTNTNKFMVSITRVNASSIYNIVPQQ